MPNPVLIPRLILTISSFASTKELSARNGGSTSHTASTASERTFTVAVRSVEARGLKSVELMGKNDPYAILSVGKKWSQRTKTIDEAGSDATWSLEPGDASWQIDMSGDELRQQTLAVVVMDANSLRSDVVIGEGEVSLSSLYVEDRNGVSEVSLSVPLFDKKRHSTGHVSVVISVLPTSSKLEGGKDEEEGEGMYDVDFQDCDDADNEVSFGSTVTFSD